MEITINIFMGIMVLLIFALSGFGAMFCYWFVEENKPGADYLFQDSFTAKTTASYVFFSFYLLFN